MVFILSIPPNTKCTFCDVLILRKVCFGFSIFPKTKRLPVCLNCSDFIS